MRLAMALRSTNVMKQDFSDISKLISRMLALDRVDDNTFRSKNMMPGRLSIPAIYGGQSYANGIRAAALTVQPHFLPHSAHTHFIKSGDVNEPIDYKVKRLRDGKSFCTRYVESVQNGELLTSSLISFHVEEAAAVQHQLPLRSEYPNPESLKSWEVVLNEAIADPNALHSPLHKKMLQYKLQNTPPIFYRVFDIRPIDPLRWSMRSHYPIGGAPAHHMYARANASPGTAQLEHRLLAALMSDVSLMETAMVDHAANGFLPSMIFSLDINVYFHGHIDMNDWVLVECISPIADGGRALAEAKCWAPDGRLVMSVTQEGIIRAQQNGN